MDPPGGWVDGEFQNAGETAEEHAYLIYVKPAQDANGNQGCLKVLSPLLLGS